jgi:hypothetical protein
MGWWLTPRADRVTPGKDSVPKAGWAPGTLWAGAENLARTGIRSTGRPARSESLYQLHYLGPRLSSVFTLNLPLVYGVCIGVTCSGQDTALNNKRMHRISIIWKVFRMATV